ncbi:MAG: pyridoxal phosphate-dependent aminotransferase [Magnetococcales bacterium]|nr:pyridoxal phosphate-dependent aminotransferase [Magnetococcales bacterium]
MSVLSSRVQKVKPSPTLAVTAKAKELKDQGRDVVGLGSGEPDFDTPDHIKEAAIEAIRKGFTKYTPVAGIPELRKAIIGKFKRDNGLEFRPNQIVVTVGGKQAFYNLAQAMLNPGDQVIIPAPYWVSYPDMVLLADGEPVIVDTTEANGFKMRPADLEAAITPRTRLVVINSPSNPTGAAYTRDELAALGEVLLRHPHVWVVSDDIYEKIVFGDFVFSTIAQVVPGLQDRTITMNGVSKTYSMTGWRIGYAAGPAEVIQAMETIQSQSTSNATSISQKAALVAIEGDQNCLRPMVDAFRQRRDFVVQRFNAIPGMHCRTPEGSFYAYPCFSGLVGRRTDKGKIITDSNVLSEYLLEGFDVAVVAGASFGKDPYFRISYATSMANLEKAMTRIHTAAERLMGG